MNKRIKIRIKVNNPNSFIKDLIQRKINLYNITINKNILELIIDEDDMKTISKIKTLKNIDVVDYYGLSKLRFLLSKNKILIILVFFSIIANIVLSNIIFKVEVETPNKDLKEIVLKDLKELGLRRFKLKISYEEKELIKEKLKTKEKDKIEWLEIEEHGTKYIVKVEEKKIKDEESSCNPRNIIASKNARITSIRSSSGEIVKKINDYVEKGEILISGLIHNKEEIVSKKCSIGEVYGETWYKVKVSVPKYYTEVNKTKNKTFGISIKLLNKEINLFNKYQIYEKKEYNIIGSKFIPLNISFSKFQELNKEEYNNTLSNVDKVSYKYAEQELEKKLNSKINIIRKKILKKTEYNSKIETEVFFAIEENIVDYQDITSIDIEELNKKEE